MREEMEKKRIREGKWESEGEGERGETYWWMDERHTKANFKGCR